MARDGWSTLFSAAFKQSKNPMALVDVERRHVDVNAAYQRLLGRSRRELLGRPIYEHVADGPLFSDAEWDAALAAGHFHGTAELVCADGRRIGVQFAAETEIATGRRLVLYVALSTARWGGSFRRSIEIDRQRAAARNDEIERIDTRRVVAVR